MIVRLSITCVVCGEERDADAFDRDRRRPAGRFSSCRRCTRARRAQWGEAHRSELVERTAEWRRLNPHEARAIRRNCENRRRARKREQFVENVDVRAVYERDAGICGICAAFVPWGEYHLDHIKPLALGGTHEYANVQTSHARCNIRKGAR